MRRLIVCADGTWNSPDQELDDYDIRKPSNVVKLSRAIKPKTSNGISQIVFYDTGVGTHNFLDKFVGGATGVGLSDNIIQGYRFLVNNYEEGDEIYLFGFSRGSFTVRSLGGLISKIGLLPKIQEYWFPEGFQLYRSKANRIEQKKYRKLNRSRDVKIKMIGVFDTVGALGIPVGFLSSLGKSKYEFHNVKLPTIVEHGYHALAIDENRIDFAPSLWGSIKSNQVVEQVWFPGVHTNIGGGYKDNGIANHALQWMVSKASSLGLETNPKYLTHYKPDHMGILYESRKGMYKLKKPFVRPIGQSLNETIHQCVFDRIRDDKSYKPVNV